MPEIAALLSFVCLNASLEAARRLVPLRAAPPRPSLPRPWHVFVDTYPDTDANFEVAATFNSEPAQEDVDYAIVECLEGSEKEDEIVAREMQATLEAGQLEQVSDMLEISLEDIVVSDGGKGSTASLSNAEENGNGEESEDDPYRDWDDLYYDDWFSEDSV